VSDANIRAFFGDKLNGLSVRNPDEAIILKFDLNWLRDCEPSQTWRGAAWTDAGFISRGIVKKGNQNNCCNCCNQETGKNRPPTSAFRGCTLNNRGLTLYG